MHRAGKTKRISSASSGFRSQYSRIVGFSPRRWRSRNSSASNSTGLRSALESFMVGNLRPLAVSVLDAPQAALPSFEKPRRTLHELAQLLESANVAVAGSGFLDA